MFYTFKQLGLCSNLLPFPTFILIFIHTCSCHQRIELSYDDWRQGEGGSEWVGKKQ